MTDILIQKPIWFFTSDFHFDHKNVIKYCNRPFEDIEQHNEGLIANVNEKVRPVDHLVIAGDVALYHKTEIIYKKFLNRLNGNKIILKGNHDYWIPKGTGRYLYHVTIEKQFIAVSHYPMRSWNRSCHGSWNLHGHTHALMPPLRNQYDISVDNNNYYPVSFDEIKVIMDNQPENRTFDDPRDGTTGREIPC